MVQKDETLSTESRLLAALAHGSVVIQGLGLLVGVVVYVTQRERSRYAAFQALQAAVYQLINLIIIGLLWVLWGIFYAATMVPMLSSPRNAALPSMFLISLGSSVIPIALSLAVDAYGLWGALRTWQGRAFRYPVIGRWLEGSGLWNGR